MNRPTLSENRELKNNIFLAFRGGGGVSQHFFYSASGVCGWIFKDHLWADIHTGSGVFIISHWGELRSGVQILPSRVRRQTRAWTLPCFWAQAPVWCIAPDKWLHSTFTSRCWFVIWSLNFLIVLWGHNEPH